MTEYDKDAINETVCILQTALKKMLEKNNTKIVFNENEITIGNNQYRHHIYTDNTTKEKVITKFIKSLAMFI